MEDYMDYVSFNTDVMYAILRIGKKHKNMYTIKGFQAHMEREKETLNADPTIENERLIGDKNIYEDMSVYLQGVKLRNNSVLAREVLLTASPAFFKGLNDNQLEQWKAINKEWLLDNFNDNCLYSTLHKDETTWHIHSLIVPKFIDKKGRLILSNTRYFDGRDKMIRWQDNYAAAMQRSFPKLERGIRYSKAKHIDIKTWYSLINAPMNENDIKSLCAKAKNSELLELKMKGVLKTLDSYKKYNTKAVQEVSKQSKELKKSKEEKEVYKEVISLLSKHYNINAEKIKGYINYAENNLSNTNERTK
jgi:hypothetical protein